MSADEVQRAALAFVRYAYGDVVDSADVAQADPEQVA